MHTYAFSCLPIVSLYLKNYLELSVFHILGILIIFCLINAVLYQALIFFFKKHRPKIEIAISIGWLIFWLAFPALDHLFNQIYFFKEFKHYKWFLVLSPIFFGLPLFIFYIHSKPCFINKSNKILKVFITMLFIITIGIKLVSLLNSQIVSAALYALTFLVFLTFFIFSYKKTSNSLFRWALIFHFTILLASAIYHTQRYDNIYYPPSKNSRAFTLAKDCYYPNPPFEIKTIFKKYIYQLKNIFFCAPLLGQTKQYLINAVLSNLFGAHFYNGYFFACCLHGTVHLGALLILFKLLESYQLSRIWQFLVVTFLSYNPYVIGIHGIPLCESACWLATAIFSFFFLKNYPFYKTFLSALLVGASHKALAFFPLLFYTSMLKNLSWKNFLTFVFIIALLIKIIILSPYSQVQYKQIILNNNYGNSTIIKKINEKNTSTPVLLIYRTIEGLFSPIVTRHGFFQVNYSTIYAVIIASYDVAVFIVLLSCIAYSLVLKFKYFEPNEKHKIIYFLIIILILLAIIGVAGINYLTQIRHRSKVMILLLALLSFLNQKKPPIKC